MSTSTALVAPTRVDIDDGHIDLLTGRISRAGSAESMLAARELALLRVLVAAPGSVSREALAAAIAEPDEILNHRALDHLVFRLRAAIEVTPRRPARILTERARGYRWVQAAFAPTTRPRHASSQAPLFGREGIVAWLRDLQRGGRPFHLHGCPGIGLNALCAAAGAGRFTETAHGMLVPVPPLDAQASRQLMEYRLSRVAGSTARHTDAHALSIVAAALGGHPWSLCRVASRVAMIPLPALVELADEPLALLSVEDRAQVVTAFSRVQADLEPALRPEPLWSAALAEAGGRVA